MVRHIVRVGPASTVDRATQANDNGRGDTVNVIDIGPGDKFLPEIRVGAGIHSDAVDQGGVCGVRLSGTALVDGEQIITTHGAGAASTTLDSTQQADLPVVIPVALRLKPGELQVEHWVSGGDVLLVEMATELVISETMKGNPYTWINRVGPLSTTVDTESALDADGVSDPTRTQVTVPSGHTKLRKIVHAFGSFPNTSAARSTHGFLIGGGEGGIAAQQFVGGGSGLNTDSTIRASLTVILAQVRRVKLDFKGGQKFPVRSWNSGNVDTPAELGVTLGFELGA